MKIILDIDGVILDFVGATLRLLNSRPRPNKLHEEDVTDYDIAKALHLDGITRRWLDREWQRKHFCTNINVYPGAYDLLTALRTRGRVVAVTAPLVVEGRLAPLWVNERYKALRFLGFLDTDIVFAKDKAGIRGDIIIEDSAANARAWGRANGWGRAFLVDRPWNREGEFDDNVYKVTDPAAVLNYIDNLNHSGNFQP